MRDDPAPACAVYPSLADRRVVVTGGGSGIGEAIVEAFSAQGARVAFVDIADAPSRALAARLAHHRHPPRFVAGDVTDLPGLARALADIADAQGPADVLVNNAGNDDRHALETVTPEYFDNRIAVNLRHMFFAAQAVAPAMRAARRGSIINLGSIAWHVALPGLVLYETAKAGVEGMTRALARDLGRNGVRVNAVVPGGVKTPRQDALWHDAAEEARILAAQCLDGRVMPADVAALALFLASDDARMITGHAHFVDAGWK